MSIKNNLYDNPMPSWLNRRRESILFWFNIYTFAVWSMMMAEFFSNGKFVLISSFVGIYISFLTAFVGHKELVRWRLNKNYKRRTGEIWVYAWLITGLVLCILKGLFPQKYISSLKDLATIVGITITYFALTEYSKFEYSEKKKTG